jgi:SAM-dependent methyltransferase
MKNYEEIFSARGSRYDDAMRHCPNARDEEFAQVINCAKITGDVIVADAPSGGGYLQAYLPNTVQYLGHDPCASFTNHGQVTHNKPLLPLPWPNETVDIAISLAGIHHLNEKKSFFKELHRITKPKGRMIISDVAKDSSVAKFLDGFVGSHNSTGHEGIFLDEMTFEELKETEWTINKRELNNFHWRFANREEMVDFCHDLFDIQKATRGMILRAIEAELGTNDFSDGTVGMNWSLLTIEASKNV